MIRQGGDRHRGLAVDPAFARDRRVRRGCLDPGADSGEPERAVDLGCHRPGAVAFLERDLIQGGAAQATSGRQERDRLDQIGLAGAVGPDQHDRPGAKARSGPSDSCGNWSGSGGGCGRRSCASCSPDGAPAKCARAAAGGLDFDPIQSNWIKVQIDSIAHDLFRKPVSHFSGPCSTPASASARRAPLWRRGPGSGWASPDRPA